MVRVRLTRGVDPPRWLVNAGDPSIEVRFILFGVASIFLYIGYLCSELQLTFTEDRLNYLYKIILSGFLFMSRTLLQPRAGFERRPRSCQRSGV